MTGSDSPVSSDSSSSSPSAAVTMPSARLVARAQADEVVEHDLLDRDLDGLAVAYHHRARRAEHREPVEGALGAVLLTIPMRRCDQHQSEERILDRSDDQDDDEHRPEDGVEAGEDVRPAISRSDRLVRSSAVFV